MEPYLHPAKLILGGLLALGASFLAYRSWDDAHYAYLSRVDFAAAHVARPLDAYTLGRVFDSRLQKGLASPIAAADLDAGRKALIETPLSRVLLRTFGIQAEIAGNLQRAEEAYTLSNTVSRRDVLTQLWMIERSVSKEDMDGALQHYHAVLSVHPEVRPALYPILSKAIAYPEIRKALVPYIARQAQWSTGFLGAAIGQGDPRDVAQLMILLGDMARGEAYQDVNAKLFSRLGELGEFGLAAKLTQAVLGDTASSAIGTFAVSDATTDRQLGRLAWALPDGSIFSSPNDNGGIDIDIETLSRGVVASRLFPVTGGRTYVLSQTVHGISSDADAEATLTWQAACLPSQVRNVIWQQLLPKPRETQRYEMAIDVPVNCKGLELILTGRGPEGQQSAHLALDAFDFKPRQN